MKLNGKHPILGSHLLPNPDSNRLEIWYLDTLAVNDIQSQHYDYIYPIYLKSTFSAQQFFISFV